MFILLPMYIREPRAERLGWTTYRALRYIHTCTYVCRGPSLLLNITHKIVDSGNTLPTQCTTMGGKTITLLFSNTYHTCPLMSALLQGNEYLHKATAHTIVSTYTLRLSTVKDDRHEKEERKTKH